MIDCERARSQRHLGRIHISNIERPDERPELHKEKLF